MEDHHHQGHGGGWGSSSALDTLAGDLGGNKYVLARQSSGRDENSSLVSEEQLHGNRYLIMSNKGQLARESNATFSIFILRLSKRFFSINDFYSL